MTLIPDIRTAIGQTIFGGGGIPYADSNRLPFSFSSARRLKVLEQNTTINQIASLSAFGREATVIQGEMSTINMAINPKSISFDQPKRIVKRDVQNGSIFFHFTDNQGKNNDILTMNFTGNTGNLDIRGDVNSDQGLFSTIAGGQSTGAHNKLLVWHNLWSLTREPMLLEDNTRNEMYISYSSVAIPTEITFIGHFNEVLKFTENAEKPMSRDYSMSFTVKEVSPPLDDIVAILQERAFAAEEVGGQVG